MGRRAADGNNLLSVAPNLNILSISHQNTPTHAASAMASHVPVASSTTQATGSGPSNLPRSLSQNTIQSAVPGTPLDPLQGLSSILSSSTIAPNEVFGFSSLFPPLPSDAEAASAIHSTQRPIVLRTHSYQHAHALLACFVDEICELFALKDILESPNLDSELRGHFVWLDVFVLASHFCGYARTSTGVKIQLLDMLASIQTLLDTLRSALHQPLSRKPVSPLLRQLIPLLSRVKHICQVVSFSVAADLSALFPRPTVTLRSLFVVALFALCSLNFGC